MSSIFIIDSGSTLHTTVSDEAILINKRPSTRKATGATGATGTEIRFTLVGDVQLTTEEYLIITDVHCSSQIVVNVIRVLLILRTKQSSEIKKLFARCPTITNYTTSTFKTPKNSTRNHDYSLGITAATWHQRLGHVSHDTIHKMHKRGLIEIQSEENPQVCQICPKAKMCRKPFKSEKFKKSRSHLCGSTRNGNSIFW